MTKILPPKSTFPLQGLPNGSYTVKKRDKDKDNDIWTNTAIVYDKDSCSAIAFLKLSRRFPQKSLWPL